MDSHRSFLGKPVQSPRATVPEEGERGYTLPLVMPTDDAGRREFQGLLREAEMHLATLGVQHWLVYQLTLLEQECPGVTAVRFDVNPSAVHRTETPKPSVRLSGMRRALRPGEDWPAGSPAATAALKAWREDQARWFPGSTSALQIVDNLFTNLAGKVWWRMDGWRARLAETLPPACQAELRRVTMESEFPAVDAPRKPRM